MKPKIDIPFHHGFFRNPDKPGCFCSLDTLKFGSLSEDQVKKVYSELCFKATEFLGYPPGGADIVECILLGEETIIYFSSLCYKGVPK